MPESSIRRTGRIPSDRRTATMSKPGNAAPFLARPGDQRDMRPFHLRAHRARVVETEQAVRVVDQHVEVLEEILAEDALDVEIGGMEILEVIHEHLLLGNGVGAGFDQVELREGSWTDEIRLLRPRPRPEYPDEVQRPERDRPS